MVTLAPPLSRVEKARLTELELRMERNSLDTGRCLREILDRKLWRGSHDSFLVYVEGRGISKTRAYGLIAAARAADNVADLGGIQPANESQLRPLVGLPAEEQRKLWAQITEGGEAPTRSRIEALLECRADGLAPEVDRMGKLMHRISGLLANIRQSAARLPDPRIKERVLRAAVDMASALEAVERMPTKLV